MDMLPSATPTECNALTGTHVFPGTLLIEPQRRAAAEGDRRDDWTAQEMTDYLTKL